MARPNARKLRSRKAFTALFFSGFEAAGTLTVLSVTASADTSATPSAATASATISRCPDGSDASAAASAEQSLATASARARCACEHHGDDHLEQLHADASVLIAVRAIVLRDVTTLVRVACVRVAVGVAVAVAVQGRAGHVNGIAHLRVLYIVLVTAVLRKRQIGLTPLVHHPCARHRSVLGGLVAHPCSLCVLLRSKQNNGVR